MADDRNTVAAEDPVAASRDEKRPDRWPLCRSALVITASSIALWALIIAAVRWLVG